MMEIFSRCQRWRAPINCVSALYVNNSQPSRSLNCNTSSVCKVHRKTYERTYPTLVVQPDGSSINIRYHEPRKIIKLPLDLATLTDLEKKMRLDRCKPMKKLKIEEDIDDEFDSNKYLNLLKK